MTIPTIAGSCFSAFHDSILHVEIHEIMVHFIASNKEVVLSGVYIRLSVRPSVRLSVCLPV